MNHNSESSGLVRVRLQQPKYQILEIQKFISEMSKSESITATNEGIRQAEEISKDTEITANSDFETYVQQMKYQVARTLATYEHMCAILKRKGIIKQEEELESAKAELKSRRAAKAEKAAKQTPKKFQDPETLAKDEIKSGLDLYADPTRLKRVFNENEWNVIKALRAFVKLGDEIPANIFDMLCSKHADIRKDRMAETLTLKITK